MRSRWRWMAWIFVVAGSVAVACTVALDHSAEQCTDNAWCAAHFRGHPSSCINAVCVSSNVRPLNCVPDTDLRSNQDFLNRCGTAQMATLSDEIGGECESFDPCRLGGCDGGALLDDTPKAPPVPDAGVAADAGAGVAAPQPPSCQDDDAGRGSVVFISGSSNFVTLLRKMAPIISMQTGIVPVFRITDSCTGARSMYPANSKTDHIIRDPGPGGTYAQYYDADGPHDCSLGSGDVAVDVGESEIYPETCGLTDNIDVSHHPGPILPILFVVPKLSLQRTISAQAAKIVLGTGGHVEPWTNPGKFYIRGGATATTRLVGLAVDLPVPPNRMWGNDQGSAQKLAGALGAVTDYADAESSIGLLGSDSYDPTLLTALGFQASGQVCAYLPDTPTSKDKINVRDGHYPIWGRLHFYAALMNGGYVSGQAQNFIALFSKPMMLQSLLDAFIDSSWVPECAMKVQRLTEMGDFTTDHPPAFPCGCYFDRRVTGKTPVECHPCMPYTDDCVGVPGRPACNYGYCEAQLSP